MVNLLDAEIIPINLGLVYAYLIKGKKANILVDTGFPGKEKFIARKLRANGIQPGDLNVIVITHGDIDHYGGAARLREMFKCAVLVHQIDSEIIRTGINRKIHAMNLKSFFMKQLALLLTKLTERHYRPFEPDRIMVTERLSLDEYGINGFLLHTPGETEGSISVVLTENAIVGDLIGGVFPHSSVPAYSPFSSNLSAVRESLRKVLALNPERIYTGHSRCIDVQRHLVRLENLCKEI